MSDRVTIDISDGVADVRLNRPDKLNALDPPMFAGLADAGAQLAGEKAVRAVVLSGEGRGFCAGLDFASFAAMAGDRERSGEQDSAGFRTVGETDERITHLGQQASWAWAELEVPVVAALWGPVLGGGFQVALGADIRYIAPDATMSVLEVKWGLIPDMTGTWQLPRLVGIDVAKELTWTGRMVPGTEAVELGLATHLSDDPLADAKALAADLAAKSPHAIRAGKRLLEASGTVDVAEQFARERAEIAALIGSPNQVEAVRAGLEKSTPTFADVD